MIGGKGGEGKRERYREKKLECRIRRGKERKRKGVFGLRVNMGNCLRLKSVPTFERGEFEDT